MSPTVSIVIPAFNEEELLPRCLVALMPQARMIGAEVIVIDNNSTDRTATIARQAGAKVIHESQAGYVYAMQRGLREATGEIVAFTDADSVVAEDWLQTIITTFANESQTVAITGHVRFEGLRVISSLRWFYRHLILGSNMAVRRRVGLAAGGFNDQYNLASDIAFGWALAKHGTIRYIPQLRISTSGRRFQAQPVKQATRYLLNHLWMMLFHRPLFWHFTSIRHTADELAKQTRRRTWGLGTTMFFLILAYLSAWPTSTALGQISVHARTKAKIIALTFDDGPNGQATRSIVDILVDKKVPATFFEVGRSVAADPNTAKYVSDHGFTIGNHSWDHSFRLPFMSDSRIERELADTSTEIIRVTGQRPTMFRPPHGLRSPQLLYETDRLGLRVIDWSIDPQDYLTGNSDLIWERVTRHAKPGRIILLHDGLQDGPRTVALHDRQATITALPRIIDTLQSDGYSFVSLDELLGPTKPDLDDTNHS